MLPSSAIASVALLALALASRLHAHALAPANPMSCINPSSYPSFTPPHLHNNHSNGTIAAYDDACEDSGEDGNTGPDDDNQ